MTKERGKIVSGSPAEWDDRIEFSSYVGYTVSIEELYQAFKARAELERHSPTCDVRDPPYHRDEAWPCTCGLQS